MDQVEWKNQSRPGPIGKDVERFLMTHGKQIGIYREGDGHPHPMVDNMNPSGDFLLKKFRREVKKQAPHDGHGDHASPQIKFRNGPLLAGQP